MRKVLFFLLVFFGGYSQTNQQLSNLRMAYEQVQVLSPSADMRNLIRFDNVDVSTYTGLPDVNIPLFNYELSRELSLDLVLKYHPESIKKEERAGTTGLGWSLSAGGSITRVIRGLPDEQMLPENSVPRHGLYEQGNVSNYANDLDDFMNNSNYVVGTFDNMSLSDKLFEALESGVYDTLYDIYYYNFMGFSGSFYVKMNNNQNLQVVKLDDNALRIVANRELFDSTMPNDPNKLKIGSFTIYDDKGNKYFFDVKETMGIAKGYRQFPMFPSQYVSEGYNDGQAVIPHQNFSELVSAYHLTNVTPYGFLAPVLFFKYKNYNEDFRSVHFVKKSLLSKSSLYTDQSYYQIIKQKLDLAEQLGRPRMKTQFGSSRAYNYDIIFMNTKKISSIVFNSRLFIEFSYEKGRLDENYLTPQNLVKLSNIKISSADVFGKDLKMNEKIIKQIKFNYVQGLSNSKKLLLKEVIEYNKTIKDEYKRKYKMHYNSEDVTLPSLYEDPWGYCTDANPNIGDYKVSTKYMKTFVLEKMELPTGGCIIYNYEPHTYSHIGSMPLAFIGNNKIGGGVRIKNIGFFDDKNVSKDYYLQQMTIPQPVKELSYNYNFPNQNVSSGSLSFSEPVRTYQRVYELFGSFAKNSSQIEYLQPDKSDFFKYKITTNNNNLHTLTTKGANVGYKYVTITERGNGKKVLNFTSPIDFPEEDYTITYPFIPSKNIDYKRGLLLNEKNYNSDNVLVSEIKNTYDYVEKEMKTGIIPYYKNGHNCKKTVCLDLSWIKAEYINKNIANCHLGFHFIQNMEEYYPSYCKSTAELMDYKIEKRAVGWAKLVKTERIDYLPLAINNIVEYTYNQVNKRIQKERKIIGNDVFETNYQYLNVSDNYILFNLHNRISEIKKIESKKNGELLFSEQKTFKNIRPLAHIGAEVYMPEKFQYSKGTNEIETRQIITRMDDVGNPLEVMKADGTYISFIWGHHKTKLIAVVENCRISEIENLPLYGEIVSLTNKALTLSTKNMLLNKYNTLRTLLPEQSQISVLIHDLGIGVVTKIDANGKTMNYRYNTFGNLHEIRDTENNLLQQYFEFYKN